MSNPNSIQYSSQDGIFQIIVPSDVMDEMLEICRKNGTHETGGILIGHYSENHQVAIINKISEPPSDSIKGKSTFYRGKKGLKRLLDKLWPKQVYYIGEWHYHPNSSPRPSSVDIKQMRSLSLNTKLNCPEPILFIIGEDLDELWDVSVHVITSSNKVFELFSRR